MGNESLAVRLVLVGGDFGASDIELCDAVTFGRGTDVDVRINHPLVSRRHCRVVLRDGAVLVTDLGSLNGTFVGSARVEAETLLPHNGLLTIGAVTFRAIHLSAESLDNDIKSPHCNHGADRLGNISPTDDTVQPGITSLAETVLNPQDRPFNSMRRPED
ncbi:MAG: FHA domain-containing protein [Planctomycetota bacterium]|nr:FHA domain-containing protein [Planctomycetota bacterium]MDA1177795.1 FHA domain-containing protein [Planctomycetota bacterium]